MEHDTRYIIARAVAYRDVGGKIVIINPKDRTLLTLNPTASEIWRSLANGHGFSEVIGLMLECYSASRDDICRDVQSFLETMAARGILEAHVS